MACIVSTVGAFDSRYFVTFSSIHRSANIKLTTQRVTVCWWSGNPIDRMSSTSHIKHRFDCFVYHTVCARQWHGYSPWVKLMLRRLRSPEASIKGSNSIISACVTSFSSTACVLLVAFPIASLSKSLVFSFSKLKCFFPEISLTSSLRSSGTAHSVFRNNRFDWCDIRAKRTHLGTEKDL